MAEEKSTVEELLPSQLIDPSERPAIPAVRFRFKRFRFVYVSIQLLRLFIGNAFLRLLGKRSARKRDDRVIRYMQRLGMLWIRIAQTFSLRGSELSSSLGLRLMDLQDRGGAVPFQSIKNIVEADLGKPLAEIFDHFEETPFAATTVSQIHRARLKNEEEWIAVKVQQPLSEAIFNRDLNFFKRLIGLMRLLSIKPGMRWDELLHELNEIKIRELNYYYEASALDALAKNLSGGKVHVPRVYHDYCRPRVLVMEFIRGALLSDLIAMRKSDPERLDAWLEKNNIDPAKVGKRLFHAMYRQIFEDNFFHGDMNSADIILLKNSHIAVIECRSAGSMDKESMEKYKMFLRALSEREYVTAAEIYFLLGSRLPRVDLNRVKDEFLKIWRVWETRTYIKRFPFHQKSLALMMGQMNRVVRGSHFAPLWSYTRLVGTAVHLDNSLAALWPEINYIAEMRRYFERAEKRQQLSKLKDLPTRMGASLAALQKLPKRTAEYSLFRETLIRRQAQVVQGSSSKLNAVIASGLGFISFTLTLILSFLLTVFAVNYLEMELEPWLGPQLTRLTKYVPDMSLLVWLVVITIITGMIVFFRSQRKQFQGREFGQSGNSSALET